MINHYGILSIGFSASADDVKSAYRKKAREVHPDAGHSGTRDFHLVEAAYRLLSEPKRRAEYDQQLRARLTSVGKVLCDVCGVANQIPTIPVGFHVRCGRCNQALPIDEARRRSAIRIAIGHQVAGLVEDAGGEVLSMARDAAVEGLDRLRNRIGIPKRNRRSS
jgi:curved DNA-binding protein CbpA